MKQTKESNKNPLRNKKRSRNKPETKGGAPYESVTKKGKTHNKTPLRSFLYRSIFSGEQSTKLALDGAADAEGGRGGAVLSRRP